MANSRACHQLFGNFFATFRISSTFFCFEQVFAFRVIASFLDIGAALSALIGHACFHILQCFSRQFLLKFLFLILWTVFLKSFKKIKTDDIDA